MVQDPTDILNWRRVDDRITLSGQPTEAQLTGLKNLGVSCVINLAPADNKGALADEARIVKDAHMAYIYIPVDFENPTEEDYTQFKTAMRKHASDTVHVHCIFNARVSAFMLRYARDGFGDPDAAWSLMDGIWRPGGVWAKFLGDTSNLNAPNRYAGFEY